MQSNLEQTNVTEQKPQINLENLRLNNSITIDSATHLNITRTKFNIINIDSIKVKPVSRQFVEKSINKEVINQTITQQDSLRLNLTGNKTSYTNWNFSVEYNPETFDESSFSQVDYQLLISKKENHSDSIQTTAEIPVLNFENDTAELLNTYSELSENNNITRFNEPFLKNNNSFLILILISVIIIGLVRLHWKDYLITVFHSIFYPASERKISEDNASNTYPSFILNFLFFYNSSIFIYEVFKLKDLSFLNFDLLLVPIFFVTLIIIFSVKNLFFYFLGNIFEIIPQIKSYIKNVTILGQIFATIIMPVICVIPFLTESAQNYLINIGVGAFIIIYILQIVKGLKIILKEIFSLYYIILYLCALEILPLLLIIKLISNQLDYI